MAITYIPVVGQFTYRASPASPAAGERVVFVAASDAIVDGEVITLPTKLAATLTSTGELPTGFTLPTLPGGVYYVVHESFSGAREDYTIFVQPSDTLIDLATVVPAVPPEPLVQYLRVQDIGVTVEGKQAAATQAEAEAGTEPGIRAFSPLRVAQAIAVTATSAVTAHEAAADPHPQYTTAAEAAAAAPVQTVAGRSGNVVLAVGDVANAVDTADARLSDAREWTAATVTQVEAEAGTDTARKAWSVLRVWQAIAAWWAASNAKAKLDGIAAGAEVNVNADWNAGSGDAQILNKPTLGTAAAKNAPASGDAAAGEVVLGNDARLSDARTPTAHTHPSTDISDSTATGLAVLTAADAAAARSVIGVAATRDSAGNIKAGISTQLPVTTGSYNVAIGDYSQQSLTAGNNNFAFGLVAQQSLTTGSSNIAIGDNSQRALTTGNNNVACGASAQRYLTTGIYNVAIGAFSQYSLTTGDDNVANGFNAQYSLTTGRYNTAIGDNSQYSLTTGNNNIASGVNAQYSLTTGDNNVACGVNAQRYLNDGSDLTSANNGVFIGTDTRASANGNTAETVIGDGARGNGSNTATIGSSSLTLLYTPGQLRALGSYSATVTDSANVNIDSSGNIKRSTATMLRRVAVPSNASASGTVGDVAYDANYAYFCTATNTWVRCALATW